MRRFLILLMLASFASVSAFLFWPVPDTVRDSPLRFIDDAERLGLSFTYDAGTDPDAQHTRFFEAFGGGVAVLDYDLDHCPDVYLTQGGPPPDYGHPNPDPSTPRPSDKLFRNINGQSYSDCSSLAGIAGTEFGHGCTVGDYNSDGFPDVYVANIGRNILYTNDGDGTFTECPGLPQPEAYTTSCLLADINADGHPDIYDVNHAVANVVHQEMCLKDGKAIFCDDSASLDAEQDRFLINSGDGSFVDVTESCGIVQRDGLGLGIVAADFDNSGRLSLFVANDATANYFFANTGIQDGIPTFREVASLAGLAYSEDGRAQACMGVALDDMNADGLLDLFITNFHGDYNTLYRQAGGGVFVDDSHSANLMESSLNVLGFGTQFLDADLDGRPDLVLTNGDVVDYSQVDPDRSHRQRPQLYHNSDGLKFEEALWKDNAGYFGQLVIGRGLAKLDWNRDGREDFIVSHINSNVGLATNLTVTSNHFIGIRLVGVKCSRDAIGTIAAVSGSDGALAKQLSAGDGYMASNERRLVFGLGSEASDTSIAVRWPDGAVQKFDGIEVDAEWIVVEGHAELYRVQK